MNDPAMVAVDKIIEAFPALRGQMLHGMPTIIRDAYAETLAAKDAEISMFRLMIQKGLEERDRPSALLEQSNRDWSETDTHIRESARRVLGDYVDGDSTCVPPVEEIVERLVKQVEELRRLLSGARSLIVNEWSGWREWEDHINDIDAALKETT